MPNCYTNINNEYKNTSQSPEYFVNIGDLEGLLCNSANDWTRPNRNICRPMAQRLLEILLRRIESQ